MPAGQELATLKVGQDAEAEARIEPTRVDPLGTASRRPNRPPTTPPRKIGRGKRRAGVARGRGSGNRTHAGRFHQHCKPSSELPAPTPTPKIGRGRGKPESGPRRQTPSASQSVRLTTMLAVAQMMIGTAFPRSCLAEICDTLRTKWTHWDLNPGPSACEADVIPLHHAPIVHSLMLHP